MIDMAHLDQAAMVHWRETVEIPSQDACTNVGKITPDMEQRASVLHDYITRFVFPLCSAMTDRPETSKPICKSLYVVDASSLDLKQAWDLRDFTRDISWILSTCYPETIDRIYVSRN
jgi:hypothetical protein